MARHRSALRLAFAAMVAMVWGTMVREPLPGLTAVLAAQILVGMPRPPHPRQAAALVAVIPATAGAAFAVSAVFSDRLLILMAALGLLFFIGFNRLEFIRRCHWSPLDAFANANRAQAQTHATERDPEICAEGSAMAADHRGPGGGRSSAVVPIV